MKRIDPNVASEFMEKEPKGHDFQEQSNNIVESFSRLKAFIEVLDGYLGYQDYLGSSDSYDKIFPFTNELKDLLERTEKTFDDFYTKLWEAGRIRSHFEGTADKGDMVFVKCHTKVERIPTTYYRERKKEKVKKAA